mmetsp:Transcript_36518/g.27086  ORF Transcript_36518/g.27086 Transcript_36518/m.27086 type:complete len:427 (+) Transcript_36518:82-1362(+)|eukprot:CAMPEP_0202968014 /NCGR_PEP_ID=MMETSP1396-20130829/13113_1 /ASSEMBLY_ACC=CAM_ASM_000872 /TAXON_ID= /ORGANISM="Pseudokeronopsis sp., Strain Brazil" /LENGTH=426 /DNA_ID=CAMNT_0049693785 /DNA_START=55 /DNA_END=1335 /DNA_ORIENTATION=-
MLVYRAQRLYRGLSRFSSSRGALSSHESEEFFVYPRNIEGDNATVNWSLLESGVTNAGLAFHNYSIPKLLKRVGVKDAGKSFDVATLKVKGSGALLEAGDNLDHDEFGDNLSVVQNSLSAGQDMFVDDLSVGSHANLRLGVRVVSRKPEVSLAARSMLFPLPEQPIRLRAARKGWNLGSDYKESVEEDCFWDGKQYVDIPNNVPRQGHRPIIVLLGDVRKSIGDQNVGTQFLQFRDEIVGATIVASDNVPVSTLFQAVGTAASVIINNDVSLNSVVLPAATFVKNGKSYVVVNATEEVITAAVASGAQLYGTHFQILSNKGVASLLNGGVSEKAPLNNSHLDSESTTAISLKGKEGFVTGLQPDNLTFPASKIILFDQSGKTDATKLKDTLVELSDVKKEVVVTQLLENVGGSIATSAAQVTALLV